MKQRLQLSAVLGAGVAAVVLTACGSQSRDSAAAVENNTPAPAPPTGTVLTGREAMGDYTTDAPGVHRKLTPADLPPPFETPSANNGPRLVPQPDGVMPKVKPGFSIQKFATDLRNPRVVETAPNGDIFVAESEPRRGEPGNIIVLRDADGDGKAEVRETFASGLKQPFGIAFYPVTGTPQYVYVANTDSVVRFAYTPGDMKARNGPEMVTNTIPGGGRLTGGGHWTRDIQFSADGRKMFVSVGSVSNINERNLEIEKDRALIYEFDPDGSNGRVYAYGIRNPVGLAIQPGTGTLWTSVNERDGLGDHLVPDYITSVKEGGFYGWPWYYIGANDEPRKEDRPELKDKVIVPDFLIQSHSASLDMCFYTGSQFPQEYRGDIFAAQHGSWNRTRRTGYKIIRALMENGKPTGVYEDFVTGFVASDSNVWGRPVGVTVARDGSLLFSDDGSNTIWRVSYTGGK
ncbi:MAG: sorbosone dehydrogenase family protein [Armatimonadaceae bacterium]